MDEPVTTQSGQTDTHPESGHPGVARWLDLRAWVRDVVISVVIAAIVIVFLYQPVKVEGTSMMPWLTDQERIFVNKFVYRFGDIQRGDIVVFWWPLDPSKSYIKRVIGLPGDTVMIDRGVVIVNGQPIDEPYVPEQYRDYMSYETKTVPPDHYYVLGDHRNASNDSRQWGMVERRRIYGKAVFVYWPLDKFGVIP
jgi:signal peptidase I